MRYLILAILAGGLGAVMIGLLVVGVREHLRRQAYARAAHAAGLLFAAADPFDVTSRYAGFVLCQAGHSFRAENVMHGRQAGWLLRAFDYRFEIGHGPGRQTRRYSVIAAETPLALSPALLWHEQDPLLPLAARLAQRRVGPWRIVEGQGERLIEALAALADEPLHVYARPGCLVLACARRWSADQMLDRIQRTAATLESLKRPA